MNQLRSITLGVCLFAGLLPGRTTPDIQITPPQGKPISLKTMRGEVVVCQFLLTTCSHCQATARMLSELQDEFKGRGLRIIGLAFDPFAQIPTFTGDNKVTFPVGAVDRLKAAQYLGYSPDERFVVPQMMIIGRDGQIRAQSEKTGSPELQDKDHLRELLTQLLNESKRTTATY